MAEIAFSTMAAAVGGGGTAARIQNGCGRATKGAAPRPTRRPPMSVVIPKRLLFDAETSPTRRQRLHGRFALGERRGAGAFGIVLRIDGDSGRGADTEAAADTAPRVVKFQRLRRDEPDDDVAFMLEVRALYLVRQHPNIVHLVEYMHTPGGHSTMVLRECVGPALDQRLLLRDRPALPRALAARWARQLFAALAYCHERRVIHRDVKPQNIMLSAAADADAQLVLADFGAAHVFDSADAMQRGIVTDEEYTTLWYRAPELVADKLNHSAPVDVWSAGCVLAELYDATAAPHHGPLFRPANTYELGRDMMRSLGAPTANVWPDGARAFAEEYGATYGAYLRVAPTPNWPQRRATLGAAVAAIVDATVAWAPAARPSAGAVAAQLESMASAI